MKKIIILAAIAAALFACKSNEPENQTTETSTGALSGVFSVSPNKKVHFSKGNLQYQASTGTWRFAEKQYDFIGSENENISATYSGWIDLFGWGTSGYNLRYPYMTSKDGTAYGDGEKDISGTKYDWGVYNAISNGGNKAGLWRTLTWEEYEYLFSKRENAKALQGIAQVNGINGLVILPDEFNMPNGLTFQWSPNANSNNDNYSMNTYSLSQWKKMEDAGAVFWPAADLREKSDAHNADANIEGYYWSSTQDGDDDEAVSMGFLQRYRGFGTFSQGWVEIYDDTPRALGYSVRLVQDID